MNYNKSVTEASIEGCKVNVGMYFLNPYTQKITKISEILEFTNREGVCCYHLNNKTSYLNWVCTPTSWCSQETKPLVANTKKELLMRKVGMLL